MKTRGLFHKKSLNKAKFILWPVISYIIFTLALALYEYSRSGKKFLGSPDRICENQRNTLDLNDHGEFFERYFKFLRARSQNAFVPGFGPYQWIAYKHTGWKVLTQHHPNSKPCSLEENADMVEEKSCICVTGIIETIAPVTGDGDINIYINLDDSIAEIVQIQGLKPKKGKTILVEVDENMRDNFPLLYDIAKGDRLRACGSHVIDMGHAVWHVELHPLTWLEILSPVHCDLVL